LNHRASKFRSTLKALATVGKGRFLPCVRWAARYRGTAYRVAARQMKQRISILSLASFAAILSGASTSTAQTDPHALPYSTGNWIGAGWYIYAPPPASEQLEYGIYRSKELCQADKKRMSDSSNEEMRNGGLPALPDPYLCAYFGTQPTFDKG
jgi:hypothetical protein